jgi:hypothetical protein
MEAKVTSFRTKGNLGVVQLTTAGQGHLEHITAARAMREGRLAIKEVSEAGSVHTLLVVNDAGTFVFLADGDILAGAKQTRVVNTSILLAPLSTTPIPVSCVEQGRWRFTSPGLSSADFTAPSALRAAKAEQVRVNLRAQAGHQADQGDIWARVGDYQEAHGVRSATGSLADVFDGRKETFDAFLESFTPDPAANGMGVYIGGTLACIDIFNSREVYREYVPKLVRGAAMEAWPLPLPAKPLSEAEARFTLLDAMDHLQAAERETFAGVGVGEEDRFEAGGMTGSTLRHLGALIHWSALRHQGPVRGRGPHRRPAQG